MEQPINRLAKTKQAKTINITRIAHLKETKNVKTYTLFP